MDLSLLPSFAHYSLMSNSTSNYGHSYPSAHIDDYGSTFAQTASALYQHNHRSSLVPYPDPYLVQSSLLKESTPDHVSEGPTEHCSYYYLDNKLCHPEWPHLTPFDNTTSDGKLGPLALGATSLVPISTPPLTPRTPDCKSNFCSHPRPVPEEPLLEKSSAARSLIASKVINDDDNYITITSANGVVRVKRRSANKKERRRTQSINSAFSNLRDCIPNVPADTKLSKIKTLRLATSYISYLMELLEGPRENSCKLLSEGFRADLSNSKRSSQQNRLETQNVSSINEIQRHLRLQTDKQSTRRQSGGSSENRGRKSCDRSHSAPNISSKSDKNVEMEMSRELSEVESLSGVNFSQSTCGYPSQGTKPKCRTGWPQHVWALELKQYDQ